MLLSRTVSLSILACLGANAMIIPNIEDIIETFQGSELLKLRHAVSQPVKHLGELKDVAGARLPESLASPFSDFEKKISSKAPAPFLENGRNIIPHRYIVVFKTDLPDNMVQFHREWISQRHAHDVGVADSSNEFFTSTISAHVEGGFSDMFNIADTLKGYSGYFLDSTIEWIRRDPAVAFVEKDSMVLASEFEIQKGAPWGLARVSHREPITLGNFNKYLHDSEGGEGVTAYVIDTGVYIDHSQFEGRAKWGKTIPTGDADTDGNGHGTHCAGTIASRDYGVAKKATIVGIKVLRSNGSGSMSDVIKGVEFAVQSHRLEVHANRKGFKGSTANMSLGGGKSPSLDLAVNAAVKSGIHFAVAAGNENQDASNSSPASAELAITVGASTITDARAYFSNYGSAVDIFAPGLNILSTYIGSETSTATLSGTSMASPHICGLLTYYLSLRPGAGSEFFVSDKGISTSQMKKNLINFGTSNKLTGLPNDGTPNILAFNGAGHNLTDFWTDSTSKDVVKSFGKPQTGINIEASLESFEAKAEQFAEEVGKLVAGLQNKD